MGSLTGESGLVAGKVVVVMAARRAWEGQPFALFHIPPWYQEVCEVLFRLFPNCVFAFSRPLTILRGFRWFFLRFAAALAPATNAVIGPKSGPRPEVPLP